MQMEKRYRSAIFLRKNVYIAEIEFNNLLILLLGIIDMVKAEW